MAKKYNIEQWRSGYWCVGGRFSAVMFKEGIEVNTKLWKNVNDTKDEWMPKLNSKLGKQIQEEFSSMPKVSKKDVNSCIGWDEDFSKSIGFNTRNSEFYGFTVRSEWGVKIPKDCTEITETEYNKLFE